MALEITLNNKPLKNNYNNFMSNKDFDNLPEQPVAVKGVEKPKPAREFLEPYYKTLGDGTLELLGIKTGIAELDKKTLGLDGLIVLGGIAGQGKTSLALQLAFDACELGTPTIFYSLEMPRRAIFTKILNRLAQVKYSDILLKGRQYLDETRQDKNPLGEATDFYKLLSKDQASQLKQAKEKLTKTSDKFYLRTRESKEADISFESVEREINLIKAEHKANKVLVVIDHLQVFNAGDYKDQIDKEGRLITGFRGISERTGATIVLVSQKNKAGFTSRGLQTIKGSADVVMFLESDEEKKKDNGDLEDNIIATIIATFGEQVLKKIDLVIDKNRYNAPCKIELDFNGEYSSFTTRQ
jgi:replicative DNA helicase